VPYRAHLVMHGYEATREAANGGVCEELGDGEARSGGGLGSRPVGGPLLVTFNSQSA
jgi:hypothetical protein